MNSALELHDSTLAGLSEREGSVIVALRPAYLHKSDGQAGVDAGTGWWLDLDLRIAGASVEGSPSTFPVEIMDGSLEASWVKHDNVVPFPLPVGGPIELILVLEAGGRLVIRGSEITPEPRSEPKYAGKFAGGPGA